MFQLTQEEVETLISQNAMSKPGRGGRRTLPYVFTEHGAIMRLSEGQLIRKCCNARPDS